MSMTPGNDEAALAELTAIETGLDVKVVDGVSEALAEVVILDGGLVAVEETLRRVRHSRHVSEREVVFAAAGTLPFGGTLDLQTRSVTPNCVLRTQLTAVAAGFGALSLVTSSSLTRTISRCGGLVRASVQAGRSNALHVILPC